MSKKEKRLDRIRENPKNVSFEELKQVLEDHGFEQVRTAGSHHTFIAVIDDKNWRITIPFQRPIKIPYVKEALKAIEEIIQIQGEDDDGKSDH